MNFGLSPGGFPASFCRAGINAQAPGGARAPAGAVKTNPLQQFEKQREMRK
jgi:hypothetical protein